MQPCRSIVAQGLLGLQAASVRFQPGWHGGKAAAVGLVPSSNWVPAEEASPHSINRRSRSFFTGHQIAGVASKHSGQFSTPAVLGWHQEEATFQQQVDALYSELSELGFQRKFVEKLVKKKIATAVDTDELKKRIRHLWGVTQASTEPQRRHIAMQIYHTPELLHYQPGTLTAKAQDLTQQLQQLGLQQSQTQQLISTWASVLTFRTEAQVQKMQEMSQRLGVQPEKVLKLWLRNRSMINLSTAGLDHKLQALGSMLHLQHHDVAKLVTAQPVVLVSDLETVRQRWQAVQQCMRHVQPEQLGQALVSQGSVLTQRPQTLQYKWRVIQAYAAAHQPSRLQLEKTQPIVAALCLLNRSLERIQLLEYILEQLQGIRCSTSNSMRHARSNSLPAAEATDRPRTATTHPEGAAAAAGREVLVETMPLLKHVTNSPPTAFLALVEERYPGFWEWQKQQEKVCT